ncbi:hypothetical protein ACFQJ7_04110 [Halovenus rubra]|uniref:Uncharacterized protein n=2 Tax=Halovenus rubra TaxID=869890 RepID=A0ACC7DXG4_9EURY|nr:hypothetical protein [Halovenus rubra]
MDGQRDRLDPTNDSGVFLSPADTENGNEYAELNSQGNLSVEIDVFAGTKMWIDDVFVVGLEDTQDSVETAEVWLEQSGTDELTLLRMDTKQPVEGEDNAIRLEPDEHVALGFVVEADSDTSGTFVETVTYRQRLPEDESETETESPGQGPPDVSEQETDTPTDPDSTPTQTPDDETETTPTPDPDTDPTATPDPDTDPTATPDPDTDPTATPDPDTDPGTDTTPDNGSQDTDEFVPGEEPTAVPLLGALPFDFGSFIFPWYVWLPFIAIIAVLTNYLTQTRVRDVRPLLKTPAQTRRPRVRYALVRLGLLWLNVLVLSLVAMGGLWSAGIRGMALFLTVLGGSAILGGMLGYRRLPDIEGEYIEATHEDETENA